MRAAYYGGTALTGSGQSLGLLEYYGTDLADLSTYYTNAGQTNNVPITLLSTDGTSTSCVYSKPAAMRRYGADPRYDAGAGHGAGPGESGDVRGLDRCGDLQCHGYGQAAERAVELFLDLEPGGPEHRRSVLRGVRGAGAEPFPGGRATAGHGHVGSFEDLSGG